MNCEIKKITIEQKDRIDKIDRKEIAMIELIKKR